MLKYVIILLDKTSASYCHADNPYKKTCLMPMNILKEAIFWSMKENLYIQFVYPDYELPNDYKDIIKSIDHISIGRSADKDVVIIDSINSDTEVDGKNVVVRAVFQQLINNKDCIVDMIRRSSYISVILTDINSLENQEFEVYKQWIESVSIEIQALYLQGHMPQLNLITDRLVLDTMKNCNAGWESITIAPNGKFYICPAFYYSDENDNVGSLEDGLDIKNQQLYRLDYAPICRKCDAYQCHRCVWLNRKLTCEVNTPSRQQCIISHIERNASRNLLINVRKHGEFLPGKKIKEIDYLDPFDKIISK